MPEVIQDLIEKIHQDGIQVAEEKAKNIEDLARKRADETLASARREAEEILRTAREKVQREEEREKILLAQAGRDLLLSLKNEIHAMLGRIVLYETRQSLSPDALSRLVSDLIRKYGALGQGDVEVSLRQEDLIALENSFLQKLLAETRKEITLRPDDEVSGGFTISFDKGASCYDFTDTALADYIGTYIKPRLNQTLQDAIRAGGEKLPLPSR